MKIVVLELFLYLIVISHVGFGLDDLVSCSGSSSLLGLDKWNSSFVRCYDASGSWHGYDAQSIAIKVTDTLQNTLNVTLPIPRSKFKRSFSQPSKEHRMQARPEAIHVHSSDADGEVDAPVTPCCRSKVSVFYPLTGISATSRKRVAIVQIEPFKQPVVYERCHQRKCRILRGNCIQVYTPQPLYILTTDEGGKFVGVKLDFILVEAGCQCQTRPVGDATPLPGSMGVDSSVPEALHIITGSDFDEDYFAMLASIDAASAIAGRPNQVTTRFTPAVAVATSTSASNSDAQIIDPHKLGNPTTVIASTAASTPFFSFQQTEMIKSSSSPESHDLSNSNEITSPSPPEWTTTTTVLPLPELPDHGQPILILPGQFNPLLQFLKNFQDNQL